MAVDEVSAAGGVLGCKVEVFCEDSGSPVQAVRKADQLLNRGKVAFFLSGGGSAVSATMFEFAKRNKIIVLAIDPNSGELVTTEANHYSFLVPPPNSMIANVIVSEMSKLGKSVFFLTHDYSFGHTQTAEQRRVLKKFPVVKDFCEIRMPLGARDFSSQTIVVRNVKPDMFVSNVAGVDSTALLQQSWDFGLYKEAKVVIPLLDFENSWAIGSKKNTLIALAGVEWHYNVPTPQARGFKQCYQQKYPKAQFSVSTTNTVNAYLGARETLHAIQRAGTTDNSDKVAAALEGCVVKNSLKPDPLYIRATDYQWAQDFFICKTKDPADSEELGDTCDLVTVVKGADIVVRDSQREGALSYHK